ncbi:immunity 49 family protein [Nocardiopsis alba]|jgi:hypothetical protein|uniref:immunity 49 family protein n=1 Tax=Nocardiopsis TaxID=2013 RepID=UPI0005A99D15|nr:MULTISPECIES: immunity 49 family protein [Nocardiopsis]MEC3894685.1 immunity 49 family protein [Nocardiopsis sp. LDBS1602]
MVFVPRTSSVPVVVDEEKVRALEEVRIRYARLLEEAPAEAARWLTDVYDLARKALAADPECTLVETWETWTFAAQYHHAVIAAVTVPRGSEVRWTVEHEERVLVSPGPLVVADRHVWLRTFLMALVCRDEKRVRHLAGIDVGRMPLSGEARYPGYLLPWIDALRALIEEDDRMVPCLRKAMELSDSRRVASPEIARELDLLAFPELDLFRAFLGGDPDDFERTLVRGLEAFDDFHARAGEGAGPGTFPLGLLALASLALDRARHESDYRMDVRSDHLPRVLLEGFWFGEFPV